jgi:ABC-2 type transport system ATP-binding protein
VAEAALAINGLTKRFGGVTAVDGVTFRVARGEVVGFLGPNGAGKSTTMRMATGFLAPSAGTAAIAGHDVFKAPLAARRRLGYLPEGAPLYPEMTPRGLFGFLARLHGLGGAARREAIERAVAATDLAAVVDRPVEALSKGFRRRVGLSAALLHRPEVLILDEPTDGLDPNQKHQVRALIRALAAETAIVVSTHILEEVEAVCSRAILIDRGRLRADAPPADLAARSADGTLDGFFRAATGGQAA